MKYKCKAVLNVTINETIEAITDDVAKKKIEEDLAKKIAYKNIFDYVKVTVTPVEEKE